MQCLSGSKCSIVNMCNKLYSHVMNSMGWLLSLKEWAICEDKCLRAHVNLHLGIACAHKHAYVYVCSIIFL